VRERAIWGRRGLEHDLVPGNPCSDIRLELPCSISGEELYELHARPPGGGAESLHHQRSRRRAECFTQQLRAMIESRPAFVFRINTRALGRLPPA
jgi:hypothetical protein